MEKRAQLSFTDIEMYRDSYSEFARERELDFKVLEPSENPTIVVKPGELIYAMSGFEEDIWEAISDLGFDQEDDGTIYNLKFI